MKLKDAQKTGGVCVFIDVVLAVPLNRENY